MQDTSSRGPGHFPARAAFAVGLGNALEFYDFVTFSFFALQIGRTFFPQIQPSHALLYALATFGAGFLTRPLGGLVIGAYGDRAGRRPAMMLSITIMGTAIVGMALTPSYAAVGIIGPITLLIFRLLQGFALGGEVGPSTAYLVEAAPLHRRGLYSTLQSGTQALASLAAGVVGFALASCMSEAALDAWGWRVALLIGAAVVPAGLYIRHRLPEAAHWAGRRDVQLPRARVPLRLITLSALILGAMTIQTYVRNYMTTYAKNTLKLAASAAFGATIVGGACALLGALASGVLSDRVGRKPVMLGGLCVLLLTQVPGFILMNRFPTIPIVFCVTGFFSFVGVAAAAPSLLAITESIPSAIRSGTVGTLYSVAIAIFGGTTQFVIQWLIGVTGNPISPGWYNAAALVVGGIAMAMIPESAPRGVPRS